jgi:hypothetical protein
LITSTPIANSTGYLNTFTNIGELEGNGIEIDLDVHAIKNDKNGFNWELGANFFKGEMIVTDLGDLEKVTVAGFTNLGNQAIEGEQLGVMVGSRIKRDANNNYVVNSTGSYEIEAGPFIIGNPNPDFTLNTNSTMSYKNFNFSFLISYVSGGDIYSGTSSALLARGLTSETANRVNTFVLPGVKADGSKNDIQINNSDYYFTNIGFGPDELSVFDGSVIRLNEVSLGYTLPSVGVFKIARIYVAGKNLLLFTNYSGFDPEVNTDKSLNGVPSAGIDYLSYPRSKAFALGLNVTF